MSEIPNNNHKKDFLRKILPFLPDKKKNIDNSQLNEVLNCSKDKIISPEEHFMLKNILALGEARAEDIMIPRSEIEAVSLDTSLIDALKIFEKSGYSRMPVYNQSLDDPRGMIHIRDILNYLTRTIVNKERSEQIDLASINLNKKISDLRIMRTILFVPSYMLANKLLTHMQASRTQLALVIDEHGGTDGLISMEDIVELIVGAIEDEHDEEVLMIFMDRDNSWLIDARAPLEDVACALGSEFEIASYTEDVDTIGGMIVSMLNRIPVRGEFIQVSPKFRFRVLEADKKRIKKLRVTRI